MPPKRIHIRGARVNNLKNISCQIPHEALTIITGPSGSGKSSLAFDTLYAEGQRRYVESMSSYARQFFERIEKPDVDAIEHILPAIALEQKNSIKNARSTVGTATEIYDHLRILFARLGETRCPTCNLPALKATPQKLLSHLETYPTGTKLLILAPIARHEFLPLQLIEKGYFRLYHEGQIIELQPTAQTILPETPWLHIVVDRVILKDTQKDRIRLLESLQNAMVLSRGLIALAEMGADNVQRFQAELACPSCETRFTEPTPQQFSFNHPVGACTSCEGFGRIIGLDLDKVIPNKQLSLAEGAIHPFTTPANQELQTELLKEAKKRKIPTDVPYQTLSNKDKAFILEGGGSYEGIRPFFDWLETKKYKVHIRVFLAKYRGYYECPTCQGSRLKPEALNVKLSGKTILELCQLSIADLSHFLESLSQTLSETEQTLFHSLLEEAQHRVQYLNQVGLSYLTLGRHSRTLSGGETQRINLSTALGSALTDTLYVLDEPTIGLHARDTERLLMILKALRDTGNTLVIVEHDPEVFEAADHLIDIGPGGGEEGGRVVYEGDYQGLLKTTYSQTALGILKAHSTPSSTKASGKAAGKHQPIKIKGASGNNLKNLTVEIPTGQLVCITGVSGSGKSTLIKQTLYIGYQQSQGNLLQEESVPFQALNGLEQFSDVVLVDQNPPGRSNRSNPVTYVKAYDEIRQLFASTHKAQVLGIQPGHFSFNTPGGRCETCEGLGTVTIDMQFMADITIQCQDCKGRRFNPNVLSIEYNGKSIDAILQLTVNEALHFFENQPKLLNKLMPLHEIGLGYLQLGQSTSTLSGGEAQRLKLASYIPTNRSLNKALAKQASVQPTLFLFDEPTTGLHLGDIDRLVQVFRKLLSAGHSVIVIEHHLTLIRQADHVIDIGPDGGSGGGEIVAEGTVADICACPDSLTGRYLQGELALK